MTFLEVKKLLAQSVRKESGSIGDMHFEWYDDKNVRIARGKQSNVTASVRVIAAKLQQYGPWQRNHKRVWRGYQAAQLVKCGKPVSYPDISEEITCTWQSETLETVAVCTFTN